jgi:PAS domain S-box-containing protein
MAGERSTQRRRTPPEFPAPFLLVRAVESMRHELLIYDRDLRYVYANPAFLEARDLAAEQVVGRTILEVSDNPELVAVLEPLLQRSFEGERFDSVLVHNHIQNEIRTYELGLSPMWGDDGRTEFVLASLRDVTDRMALEVAQRRVERLEAITRLASGVAHDFNNQLQVMAGMAELLRESVRPADHELLDGIEQATRRASATTRQLLAFAREVPLEENRPVVVDDVLRNLLEAWLPSDGVHLRSRLELGSTAVMGAASLLNQVFVNLMQNAQDALPEGGVITVSSRRRKEPGVQWATVTVQDDGPGMSASVLERAFEPFFTTKATGSGLGLSAVHGIVGRFEGRVFIDSEEGRGTRVEVQLPVLDTLSPAASPSSSSLPVLRGRVLVVDDEAEVREVLKRILERLGLETVALGSVEETLKQEVGEGFDVAVLDFALRDGTGLDVLQALRSKGATYPAVVVSGHLPRDRQEQLQSFGVAGIVHKPFGIRDLARVLEPLLG